MTNNQNTATPLLISGIGRSGTSALLKALALHSEVFKANKVGEAPFVSAFLNFLAQFENNSPMVDYNLQNYRLDDQDRRKTFAELLIMNQCGKQLELDGSDKKYWIAKTTLGIEAYAKAQEIFGDVRIAYIMRNGIEVINSARNFSGFSNLEFMEHCQRWKTNIESSEYLFGYPKVSVVKHDEMVAEPQKTFERIFSQLEIKQDQEPAKFIGGNIFNSSFDKTAEDTKSKERFKNRLDAWNSWSAEEQTVFIENCDELMTKYNFVRPYSEEPEKETAAYLPTDKSSIRQVESTDETPEEDAVVKQKRRMSGKVRSLIDNKISVAYFDYVCNVSIKNKFVFVNVPKVASTSILSEMQLSEDVEQTRRMANVHDRGNSPLGRLTEYSIDQQEEMLFGTSYKRVSFVRNPYSRILSAYLSKIGKPLNGWKVNPKAPNVRPPKAEILSVIQAKPSSEITDMSTKVSFDEFVDVVASQEVIDMDIHWKPQVAILNLDNIDYDFVGRMENFQEDFLNLKNVTGNEELHVPSFSKNKTGSSEKLNTYYNDSIIQRVSTKFNDDFEAFEYSHDLKILLAA